MPSGDDLARRQRLAALRRDLYRPDATTADVDRYVALRGEEASTTAVPAKAEGTPGVPPTAPRPAAPPGRRRMVRVGGLLLVLVAASVIALLQSRPTSGTAQAPERTAAAVPGTTVEVEVDGGRLLGQRFAGTGPAMVPLVTGGAPLEDGRLVVQLASSGSSLVPWRALGGAGRPGTRFVGGGQSGRTVVRYDGAPPARIAVDAPRSARWTMTVVLH